MDNTKTIQQRVEDHFNHARKIYGTQLLGVFLYGSQNYGLDTPESDVDTKAIILPTLDDVIFNHKPISTTHMLENGEQIDAKDIRLMWSCFRKQNINYVETLFTQYFRLHPNYEYEWNRVLESREGIARYNEYSAINCMKGMALEKNKALEHPYPGIKDKIEKYGYDGKQLHHILRIEEFMRRYIAGEGYTDCLISRQPSILLELKANVPTLDQARVIADTAIANILSMRETCGYINKPCVYVSTELDNILSSILKSYWVTWM